MTIARRDFLLASAALGFGIFHGRLARAALPRDADVVVVGAGAAGIAAARRLSAANVKVAVLEATDRLGGRCQTDLTTFGIPFDRGARWLYAQDSNPVAKLARVGAMEIYAAPQSQKIRIGRRNARSGARSRTTWRRWCAPIAPSRMRAASPIPQPLTRCRGTSGPMAGKRSPFTLGPAGDIEGPQGGLGV